MSRKIKILENSASVAETVCNFIISKANDAINERGKFTLGLSGKLSALGDNIEIVEQFHMLFLLSIYYFVSHMTALMLEPNM